METRIFNKGNVTFEYPVIWELENADTSNNPDCIATLSKDENNLLNLVAFPTHTNLNDYKLFMEDCICDDGGIILASDFVKMANMDAIRLHANIKSPQITFDIHTFVFIEDKNIYIFELRTADYSSSSISEFEDIISSFKLE